MRFFSWTVPSYLRWRTTEFVTILEAEYSYHFKRYFIWYVGVKEPKKTLFLASHSQTAAGIQYYNIVTSAQQTTKLLKLHYHPAFFTEPFSHKEKRFVYKNSYYTITVLNMFSL